MIGLTLASVFFYGLNYLIFKDIPFMFRLLTLQLGFAPISVILITLFLNELLTRREKRQRLGKLNMVIGGFFSEVGRPLLKLLASMEPGNNRLTTSLRIRSNWSDKDFRTAREFVNDYECRIEPRIENLEGLRDFLLDRRAFMLRLIENPSLLEHESFTEMLWAIFHLTEELAYRVGLTDLPDSDYGHLATDVERAYTFLVREWVEYLKHLRERYPYFYSLAVRVNPLDPEASPVVQDF